MNVMRDIATFGEAQSLRLTEAVLLVLDRLVLDPLVLNILILDPLVLAYPIASGCFVLG